MKIKQTVFKKQRQTLIKIDELKDLTTGRDLLKKNQKIRNLNMIEFIEFGDSDLVLEVSNGLCSKGNHILLGLTAKNETSKFEFNCTVSVVSIDELEKSRVRASLKLLQYNINDWKKVIKIFESRQTEVTQLLERMKA